MKIKVDNSTYRTRTLARAPQRGRQRCKRSDPSQPTAEEKVLTKVDTSGDVNDIDFYEHLVGDGADNEPTWPRPSSQTRENSVETVEENMVESNTQLGKTKIRPELVKKDKNVWVKHTKAKIMYTQTV